MSRMVFYSFNLISDLKKECVQVGLGEMGRKNTKNNNNTGASLL